MLGTVWAAWHLPLYFMEGTYQSGEVLLGSARFWLWACGLLGTTILMTWIHNNTRQSTLAAILFHFFDNFTGAFFDLSEQDHYVMTALTLLLATAVTVYWGPRTLRRASRAEA